MNPDCLVDCLNELATGALEGAFVMTRSGAVGDPLSAGEFDTLSFYVAWLSQNRYVSDFDEPDSLVNYQAETVSADSEVTPMRLRKLYAAMLRMRFVRRDVSWSDGISRTVVVTAAANSEADYVAAYKLMRALWGQDASVDEPEGFSVAATTSAPSGPPTYLLRYKRDEDGNLEVRAARMNAKPTFDFSPYPSATRARFFVKATTANPEGVAVEISRPRIAYSNWLQTPYGDWGRIADIPPGELGGVWTGEALPNNDALSPPGDRPIGFPAENDDQHVKSWVIAGAVVLIEVSAAISGCE